MIASSIRRPAAITLLAVGLIADMAGIVGFQALGGHQHMIPLVGVAVGQSLLLIAAVRGVSRIVIVGVGLAEVAVSVIWIQQPRSTFGGLCCDPRNLPELPLGGEWAYLAMACGLLTLVAAMLGAGRRASVDDSDETRERRTV